MQDNSILIADPLFAALRVVTNSDGVRDFIEGLKHLHAAGGLADSSCLLQDARQSMECALRIFDEHIASFEAKAAILSCTADGFLCANGALSPTFRAGIRLHAQSLSRLPMALARVGAEAALASILPRSLSEENSETFFSACTRISHTAQTHEEYGFAVTASLKRSRQAMWACTHPDQQASIGS